MNKNNARGDIGDKLLRKFANVRVFECRKILRWNENIISRNILTCKSPGMAELRTIPIRLFRLGYPKNISYRHYRWLSCFFFFNFKSRVGSEAPTQRWGWSQKPPKKEGHRRKKVRGWTDWSKTTFVADARLCFPGTCHPLNLDSIYEVVAYVFSVIFGLFWGICYWRHYDLKVFILILPKKKEKH